MKPSALPASSTGQWRACWGSSGRVASRRGPRPTPGRLEFGNRRISMPVCYAEGIRKHTGRFRTIALAFASESYMRAASLEGSLRRLLSPFVRLAARLVGRESAWERVAMRVPASAFGPGSHQPFAEYFKGESRVRVESIDGIV